MTKFQGLDHEIGDIHCIIGDVELAMMQHLREMVMDSKEILLNFSEFIAQLDWQFKLIKYFIICNYCYKKSIRLSKNDGWGLYCFER
jgi:hypothetical protein